MCKGSERRRDVDIAPYMGPAHTGFTKAQHKLPQTAARRLKEK
jgi:hypothetical protein